MNVSRIISPAETGPTTRSLPDAPSQPEPGPTRALVAVQGPAQTAERYAARPSAPFVAHLIAMAEQAPQTRAARREAPDVAHGVYGRATTRRTPSFGKVLSQSV